MNCLMATSFLDDTVYLGCYQTNSSIWGTDILYWFYTRGSTPWQWLVNLLQRKENYYYTMQKESVIGIDVDPGGSKGGRNNIQEAEYA